MPSLVLFLREARRNLLNLRGTPPGRQSPTRSRPATTGSSLPAGGRVPASNTAPPAGGQARPPKQARQGKREGEKEQPKAAIITAVIGAAGAIIAAIVAGLTGYFSRPPTPPVQTSPPSSIYSPLNTSGSPSHSGPPTTPTPAKTPPPPKVLHYIIPLADPGRPPTGVYGVAFSSNNELVSGDINGSAYLWNVIQNHVISTFHDGNGQKIFGIAISSDGEFIAADTLNHDYSKGSIVVWKTSSSTPAATLTATADAGFGNPPAFSPIDGTIAADSSDGSIYLWNRTSAGTYTRRSFQPPGNEVEAGIAFSPATGFLAGGGEANGNVYLWDVSQGIQPNIRQTFQDPDGKGVHGVAFNSDGSLLASGDDNGNLYLWNVATGALERTLYGPHGGYIQGIAFSPTADIVAATSDNDTKKHTRFVTCVWNLSGRLLAILPDHDSVGVTRIAFSPDGSLLATGDKNGTTYIWSMKGIH